MDRVVAISKQIKVYDFRLETNRFSCTRSPVEMDMIFIPNFNTEEGKELIFDNQDKFIGLMLMSGQIELLKRISEILQLGHENIYLKLVDRYYN